MCCRRVRPASGSVRSPSRSTWWCACWCSSPSARWGACWRDRPATAPRSRSTAFLFTVIFAAAYWTTMHMVAGQTLGKSVVGVRVVGTDACAADLRPGAPALPGVRLVAGHPRLRVLDGGAAADKRALHDLIAGSRVERPIAPRPVVRRVVRPVPPMPVEPAPMPRRAGRDADRAIAARSRAVAPVLPDAAAARAQSPGEHDRRRAGRRARRGAS